MLRAWTLNCEFVLSLTCFEHTRAISQKTAGSTASAPSKHGWEQTAGGAGMVASLSRGMTNALWGCGLQPLLLQSPSLQRALWRTDDADQPSRSPNTKALSPLCPHIKLIHTSSDVFLFFLSQVFILKNAFIYDPFQLNNRSDLLFPFLLFPHSIYLSVCQGQSVQMTIWL